MELQTHERGGVARPVPAADWLPAVAVDAWLHRIEPPAVTYRCGRGRERCDRLAFIFETEHPLGAVVVFHLNVAARPVRVLSPVDVATDPRLSAHMQEAFKRFNAGEGWALTNRRGDDAGTAMVLEHDDYWSEVVEVGCRHHLGTIELPRERLLADLARARAKGAHLDIPLRR